MADNLIHPSTNEQGKSTMPGPVLTSKALSNYSSSQGPAGGTGRPNVTKRGNPGWGKDGPVSRKTSRTVNQLSTHLPDQVVFVDHTKEMPFQRRFQGVLMFLDISGFTALCEKFAMNARNGTDQLTKTLNGYMEALVSEILSNDGDVLKFAGDAILTLWKVSNFRAMRTTIKHVIECALSIQEHYGEWTTSVGVKLRVKIGIAAGETYITYLGNNEFCHYVTQGRAVEAVNLAEKFCVSGDIVVSPSAWCHCVGLGIEHIVLSDNKHRKVTGFEEREETDVVEESPDMYEFVNMVSLSESQDDLAADAGRARTTGPTQDGKSGSTSANETTDKYGAKKSATSVKGRKGSQTPKAPVSIPLSQIRRAIIEKQEKQVEAKKKLYVALPVLRKIEERQPLEYLSEMRGVTIVFLNLSIAESTNMELALTMQQSFDVIYDNVKRSSGCMNKIFMFDKGATFLVIFGLPGFKHENDAAHALQCSYNMKKELDIIKDIEFCSIGVTTGSSFTGVVGHAHRHEYTVIGRKVNMAARLMMYYPDKVTCDNETFHHSKLHKTSFHTLELKEMKGLSNVGAVRQYTPSSANSQADLGTSEEVLVYPVIGRDAQMGMFVHEVKQILAEQGAKEQQRKVIVFEGEPGIGKTKMLDAISLKAQCSNIKVISCTLTMHDAKSPLYAMKSLLMDLLDFSYEKTHQERENALLTEFKDPFIAAHAGLLNDILQVQFPVLECSSTQQREELLREVIYRIIHEINKKAGLILCAIDDAHFMDAVSWDFIRVLSRDNRSLVVMTIRTPFVSTESAMDIILEQETTLRVTLAGLEPPDMPALACQLLGVVMIPQKLADIIREKSHGVPSWCEQLLREMMFEGVIRIESSLPEDVHEDEMVAPPSVYLYKQTAAACGSLTETHIIANKNPPLPLSTENDDADSGLVCVLAADKSLDIGLPESIKGMIQARIDRMEELDQLIIKTAAILGMSFPRPVLEAVLPENIPDLRFSNSLQRLSDCGIFICAYPIYGRGASQCKSRELIKTATCVCPLEDGASVEKPMQECQFICFYSASIQETTYDMFLENTRRKLHLKAAQFLESQAHKCGACGGGNFLQNLYGSTVNPSKRKYEGDLLLDVGSNAAFTESKESHNPNSGRFLASAARPRGSFGRPVEVDLSGDSLYDENCLVTQTMNALPARPSMALKEGRAGIKSAIKRRLTRRESMFSQEPGKPKQDPKSRRLTVVYDREAAEEALSDLVTHTDTARSSKLDLTGLAQSVTDIRECECILILKLVYPQLVRHWKAAGNVGKTVHFLMESGAASIATHDNLQALSFLSEVSVILERVQAGENPFEGHSMVSEYSFNKWEHSRMESLIGQSLFHMNRQEEAIPHFQKALHILDCEQPTSRVQLYLMLARNAFLQWRHIMAPDNYIGRSNLLFAHRLTEQARCLSHILNWQLMSNQVVAGLNSVLQQLNKAESADTDIHEVIMAYTCMMECCHTLNWRRLGQHYEEKARERCLVSILQVNPDDLVTVTHFYVTSLNMCLSWAKVKAAIESGYVAHRLTKRIHDNDMSIQLLPVFIQALIMADRVIDAVDILKELKYIQEETDDHSAETLYYGTCMDVILETGFQLESYTKCTEYKAGESLVNVMPNAHFYFLANISLWHMRKLEMEAMKENLTKAEAFVTSSFDSFLAARGFVKLVELRLLQLSRTLAKNNFKAVTIVSQREAQSKQDLKQLKKICKHSPVFKPRYHHLQAYQHAIGGRMNASKKHLRKAIAIATEMECTLEADWALHSQSVWFDPNHDHKQEDSWLKHAKSEMLDWHMANNVEGSSVKYSLPMPRWFK